MECLERWTAQKGYRLERYGLDISPELIGVARQRLTFVRFSESSIRKSATLLMERLRTGKTISQQPLASLRTLLSGRHNEAACGSNDLSSDPG
jgi:hypothetical protein